MTKPPYERPSIVRHESGMMNKFGRAQATRPLEAIDGVEIGALVEAYGSPLFVFSERSLVSRYRELHDLAALRYPKVRIAWSYKTNYLDGICRVFHREGAWAEVVSAFEYEKALRLGVPPQHVHFNGPLKPMEVLEEVLPRGVIIHIDHYDELTAAERVAEAHGIRPKVAIRVNMSVPSVPAWSRFGFNLENGQAMAAAGRILAAGHLDLVGLHCHLGTFILEVGAYERCARKLADFANELRSEHGVELDFIDIGGGFASHNKLKAQYLPGEQATPSFASYVEHIADGLSSLNYPAQKMPTLVMESGRALVDDAGYLISTVIANKRLPDDRRGVVIDAGVNTLFTSFWYDHEVVPAQPFRGVPEPTVFFGPLCMNIDVMRDALVFPSLQVGDRVVFKNTGAYNVTQWMQFITYRPAVAIIGVSGEHALLRRREVLDDVVGPEEIPPWL